jgi:hypothetical protein
VYYIRLVQQVLRLGEVLDILVLGVMNYYLQGTWLVRNYVYFSNSTFYLGTKSISSLYLSSSNE